MIYIWVYAYINFINFVAQNPLLSDPSAIYARKKRKAHEQTGSSSDVTVCLVCIFDLCSTRIPSTCIHTYYIRICTHRYLTSLFYDQIAPAPKRPRLLVSVNAKIPTALRQNYLDSFIDEYLKFCHAKEAYKKVCTYMLVFWVRQYIDTIIYYDIKVS